MKNLNDITYLNRTFIQQLRKTPNSKRFLIAPSHRQVVGGINSLREELVEPLCQPAASLFFTVELQEEPVETDDAQEWVHDYWLFVFSQAHKGNKNLAQFMIQTGLDAGTYRKVYDAPLRAIREWVPHTRIIFRHTPKMWRTILQLLSASQNATRIAPLLGVYSASAFSTTREVA